MSSPYIFSRYILWIADANIDFINAPLHFARHAAHSNYSQLDPEVRSLNTSISDNYVQSHICSQGDLDVLERGQHVDEQVNMELDGLCRVV